MHRSAISILTAAVTHLLNLLHQFMISSVIILADSQKDLANIKVEVRRIDYGDVARVSLADIKELCGEIASRPMQTLQVSLANVGDSSISIFY